MNAKEYIHYSEHPLRKLKRTHNTDVPSLKPRGLWVSDGSADGWKQWCISENFRTSHLRVESTFLIDMDKIIHIKNLQEFEDFHNKYSVTGDGPMDVYFGGLINWGHVSRDYSGIIIDPYGGRAYYDKHMWYYGWDCASGCIWRMDAIIEKKKEEINNSLL